MHGRYGAHTDLSPKGIKEAAYRNCGKTITVPDYDAKPILGSEWGWFQRTTKEVVVTAEECQERYLRNCKSRFPNHRRGPGTDTRRMKWKLLGNNHRCSWYGPGGGWYKTALHQANRRMWKKYSRAFDNLGVEEAEELYYSAHDVDDGMITGPYSEVDWKGS